MSCSQPLRSRNYRSVTNRWIGNKEPLPRGTEQRGGKRTPNERRTTPLTAWPAWFAIDLTAARSVAPRFDVDRFCEINPG